jgi:F0F1-type ATP synthase membrane subunit b/b'
VLIARDNVVTTVGELRTTYSTPDKAQRELRRFERRGTTARNRLEREVRKTRTKVERELRQRRTRAQRALKQNRTRVERELKQRSKTVDLAQARVENVLQTGVTNVTQLTTEIQKRIAAVA